MGLFDAIASQVTGLAVAQVAKGVSPSVLNKLSAGGSAVGQLLSGNILGAAATVASAFSGSFPLGAEVATQLAYMNTPTPLFGGLTPAAAQQIYNECAGIPVARKNLFLVEISEFSGGGGIWLNGPSYLSTSDSRAFNIFVTEIDYSPWTISGEKRRIGSASMDSVGGFEPVEMRLTTIDDSIGSVKQWMNYRCGLVVNKDGTVGIPYNYLVKIRVLHSFLSDDTNPGGYENTYLMRPVGLTSPLSRRDNAIEEVTLAFTQFDTFA